MSALPPKADMGKARKKAAALVTHWLDTHALETFTAPDPKRPDKERTYVRARAI
jgi:hypothetical protein